jgi:hypothetical protein
MLHTSEICIQHPATIFSHEELQLKEAGSFTLPASFCNSKHRLLGTPVKLLVSTSYVEKHNQTMRQSMRRFALLTPGHSKKIDNHVHMVALYTCWYNFARVNSAVRMSPAMACRLEQRLWDIGDIVKPIEEWERGDG